MNFLKTMLLRLCFCTLGFAGGVSQGADPVTPAAAAAKSIQPAWEAGDYTFLWWANGWKDRRPATPAILCIQTGRYGLALDVDCAQIVHLGAIAQPKPYSEAVEQGNAEVFKLPDQTLKLEIQVGPDRYTCIRAAAKKQDSKNFPVRIIESGRLVQRCDLLQLEFADAQGRQLKAEGRLEIIAWPDRLSFILELTPPDALPGGSMRIAIGEQVGQKEIPAFAAGQAQSVALALPFGKADEKPAEPPAVEVKNLAAGKPAPVVDEDPMRGWIRIRMPPEGWSVAANLDRLDRYSLNLSNPSDQPRVFRLLFDAGQACSGITGLVPMLRDADGNPSGIPVQVSKNWHRQPDRRFLYEGSWVHAFTLIRLPARSASQLEFNITYGRWGGVPSASHAQLCLIGWGWNQLWDEAALGSWGESMCYEPDGIQVRCMVDDVRPLMVWGMSKEPQRKFAWTNNVGGGDFLVYVDGAGQYQPMAAMHAAYNSHGPNLTDVTYAGVSADGHIAARIEVALARSDDIVRGIHKFRYEVRKLTPFQRLAFYQLGSDGYLWHQFNTLARGNETGLLEEWTPKRGGKVYDRTGIPCLGATPWFSLHAAIPGDHFRPADGAWANRGLVIRSWKARLGGKEAPPFASTYGAMAGNVPSASLELSPPPGLKQLEPGDFVEAEVEFVVMPMNAGEYYGPNERLRAALAAGGNTWKPILREAVGNQLRVEAACGRIVKTYPLVVEVDEKQGAELAVTGGIGYVPITFRGLTKPSGYELQEWRENKWVPVDQSVNGRDFWQTDVDPAGNRWSQTYNLPMDTPDDKPVTRRLQFRLK